MPIYALDKNHLSFPPPHMAEEDGMLAIGGDLSAERLLVAYSTGIFPWFSEHEPILWWSPDPR
ncbi:MAG: leucyl/phenylalanyl-tRNA--protein transferase, partial [Chitinophagales bacterium]